LLKKGLKSNEIITLKIVTWSNLKWISISCLHFETYLWKMLCKNSYVLNLKCQFQSCSYKHPWSPFNLKFPEEFLLIRNSLQLSYVEVVLQMTSVYLYQSSHPWQFILPLKRRRNI
jgi:hypothetical protein